MSSLLTPRRLWTLAGGLCGGALWPILTLLVVWADDTDLIEGPFIVLFIPVFFVWSVLGTPHELLGRGYVSSALVVILWAAAGAMLASNLYARKEKRSAAER
jgi:hypothetical protein